MGDPLSVAASVAGLLTIAAQSSKLIIGVVRRVKDAPVDCERASRELDDIRIILSQLQPFLLGANRPSRSRTSLVMADQVVTILASCVTTFSDVDEFAELLDNEERKGMIDRVRWIAKQKEIKEILSRLQMHKTSMNLILTILTCQIQDEAEAKVDRLCELVEQSLEQNKFLSRRLAIYEPTAMGTLELRKDMHEDGLELRRAQPIGLTESETALMQKNVRVFAFEELLNNSYVYRRAGSRGDDATSLLSTGTRACNWSMLSGLSLSEVSNISILAIPIYAEDVYNSDHYEFEEFSRRDGASMLSEPHKSAQAAGAPIKPLRGRNSDLSSPSESNLHIQIGEEDAVARNEGALTAESSKLFGISLARAVVYASFPITLVNSDGKDSVYGFIPSLVATVVAYIKAEGLQTPNASGMLLKCIPGLNNADLFTINGHAARVAALERGFERHIASKTLRSFDWNGSSIHDAASILLRYLKALPEPIIPFTHYDLFTHLLVPFIDADGTIQVPKPSSSAHSQLLAGLRAALVRISANNRLLLLYLLDFLHVLSGFAEDSHIMATKLVSIFQPSFLSRRPSEMVGVDHYLAAQTMTFMVQNRSYFLIRMMRLNLPGELDYPWIERRRGYAEPTISSEAISARESREEPSNMTFWGDGSRVDTVGQLHGAHIFR